MKAIRTILVATDLRERSAEVLGTAGRIAEAVGARLHVLHAFDLPSVPYSGGGEDLSFQGRVEEAKELVRQQIAAHVPGSVEASSDVVVFVAHKAILEAAAAVDADLIVLGTHRQRPVGDAFLGSTADRVVRTADVPVLIARPPLDVPLRKVLLPTDMSAASERALDLALYWTEVLGVGGEGTHAAELTVLHVVQRSIDGRRDEFESTVVRPELRQRISAARARAGEGNTASVREEIRWASSPIEVIGDIARDEAVDLVVIATHGHGAVRRALVGGVASGVARVAACSVLLVPPKMWSRGES